MNTGFLFYLVPSNIVDMFQCIFYLSVKNLQSYCIPRFENKFAVLNKSDFVISAEQKTKQDFRKILWTDYIDFLKLECVTTHKDFAVGNFDFSQIDFLRSKLSKSITVSFNYSESEYYTLLKQFAEFHIYRLDNNFLLPNNIDLEIKSNNRLETYISIFDNQQIFNKSVYQPADVCIDLKDLVLLDKLTDYLGQMGITLTPDAKKFHSEWLSKNSTLFK